MAKTPLNQADRDVIRNQIIGRKFTPLRDKQVVDENKLAMEVWTLAYKAYLPVMAKLPRGAFKMSKTISTNVGGRSYYLNADQEVQLMYEDANNWNGKRLATFEATSPMGEKISAFAQSKIDLERQQQDADRKVAASLKAFRSFDDLLKAWPEAEKFIKARWATRPDYNANVPMVVLKDLSKELGLPPEEEKEAA